MKRIDTMADLRSAWEHVGAKLLQDLLGANRLRKDPVGTFRQYGYLLSGNAERALLTALPI